MFDDDRHDVFCSPTPSAISRTNVQSPTEIWLNQADMNSCSSGWLPSPSGHRSHGSSEDSGIIQCAHGAQPSPAARKKMSDVSRHSVLQNLFDDFLRDAHTKKQNAQEGGHMRDESGTTTASEDEDDVVKIHLPHAMDVQRKQQMLMHNQVEQARQRIQEGWQRQLNVTPVDARDSAEELWRQESQRIQQERQQRREQLSQELLQQQRQQQQQQQQHCAQESHTGENTNQLSAPWSNGLGTSYAAAPLSQEWASRVVGPQNAPFPPLHEPAFTCAEHKTASSAVTRKCESCALIRPTRTTVAPAVPAITKTRARKLNMAANVLPRKETSAVAREEDNVRGENSMPKQQRSEELRQKQPGQQGLCAPDDAYYDCTENRGRGPNRHYTHPIGYRPDITRRTEQRAFPQQHPCTQYRSGQRSSQTTPCHTRQSSPAIADKESRRTEMRLRFDEAFQGRRTGRHDAEDHKDGTRHGAARKRNFDLSWRRLPEDDHAEPLPREKSCMRDGSKDKPHAHHKLQAASAPASLCGNHRPDCDYATPRDGSRWRTWGRSIGTTRDDYRRDLREVRPHSYYEPRRQTSCGGGVRPRKPLQHADQIGVDDYHRNPNAGLELRSVVRPQGRDMVGRAGMAESWIDGVSGTGSRDEASVSDVSTLSESESPTRRVAEAWIAKQASQAQGQARLNVTQEVRERRKETIHEKRGADKRAVYSPESPIPTRDCGRSNDIHAQKHDEREKQKDQQQPRQQHLREESWNKRSPKDKKGARDGPDDVLSWRRGAVHSLPSTSDKPKGGAPHAGSWRTYDDGAKVPHGHDTRRLIKHGSLNNDLIVGRSLSQVERSVTEDDQRRGEAQWKRDHAPDECDNDAWRVRQQSHIAGNGRHEIESGSWRRHPSINVYEYERGHADGDSTRGAVNGTRRKRAVERNFDVSWRSQSEHAPQDTSAPPNHCDERRVRNDDSWIDDMQDWRTDSWRRDESRGYKSGDHGGRYTHTDQDAGPHGWPEVHCVHEESLKMHTVNAQVDDPATANTQDCTKYGPSEWCGKDIRGKGGRGAARRDDVPGEHDSDGHERRGTQEKSFYCEDEDHGTYSTRKVGKSGWRTPPEDPWTNSVDVGRGKRYASQASTQSGCPYSEDSWRKEGESNSSAVHDSATAIGRHASTSWVDTSDTESPQCYDIRAWQKNKASKTREDTNLLRGEGVVHDNGLTHFWRQEDCGRGDPTQRSTSGRLADERDALQSARPTSSVVPRSLYMMQKPFEDAWNKLTEREMQDAADVSCQEDTLPDRSGAWNGQNEKARPRMATVSRGHSNTSVDPSWHTLRENSHVQHTCSDNEPEWRASNSGHAQRPNGTMGTQQNAGRHGEDYDSSSRSADMHALREAKQLYFATGALPSSLRVDSNEDSWRSKDVAGRAPGASRTGPVEHRRRNAADQLMNGDYADNSRKWRTARVPPWEKKYRHHEPDLPAVPSNGKVRSNVPTWAEPRREIAPQKPKAVGPAVSTNTVPPWGKPRGPPYDSDTKGRRQPQQQQQQQLHDPPRTAREAFAVIPEEDGTRPAPRYARTPSPDDDRWLTLAACGERDVVRRQHYQERGLRDIRMVSAEHDAMMRIPPGPTTHRRPPTSIYPRPCAPPRPWEGSGIKRHKLARLLRRGAKALRAGFLDALLKCPPRICAAHSVEISCPHELPSSPRRKVSGVRVMARLCHGMTSNMAQAKVYVRCADRVYRLHDTPQQVLAVRAHEARQNFVAEACIQKMVTLTTLEKVMVPDIEIAAVSDDHVVIRCLNLSGSFLEVTVLAPGREASMVRVPIKGRTEFEWRQAKLMPNEVYVAWCRVSDAAQEYWTKDSEQKGFKTLPKRRQTIWDISDFEILGVEEGASQVEIRKGYKNKCLVHHPDKMPLDSFERAEAEDMMKRLNLAKENLLSRPMDDKEATAKKKEQEADMKRDESHSGPQTRTRDIPDTNPWAHVQPYACQSDDRGCSRDDYCDSPRNLDSHIYVNSPTDSPTVLSDEMDASKVVDVNYSIFDSVQTSVASGHDAINLYINNLPKVGTLEVKVERDGTWHTVVRKKLEGRFSECVLVDQLEHSSAYSAIIDVRVPLEPITLFPS